METIEHKQPRLLTLLDEGEGAQVQERGADGGKLEGCLLAELEYFVLGNLEIVEQRKPARDEAAGVLARGGAVQVAIPASTPGGDWVFGIDALSAFFLLCITIAGIAAALFGTTYFAHRRPQRPVGYAHGMVAVLLASLSLVVVISDIGVRTHSIGAHVASALVGAALLSVLIFPTLASVLRPRGACAAAQG